MKSVSVLGSTGSVGTATIDVLNANPGEYKVRALTAKSNVSRLAQQAIALNADIAVIEDEACYQDLKDRLAGTNTKVAAGRAALIDAASEPADWTMTAIVGMAGLEPMMAAIKNGKQVAIANKEPLVSAGALVMEAAKKSGATLIPVDSEHNAIFQVFEEDNRDSITRLILTGSGGPFRSMPMEQLASVTPNQAIAHPNWSMGPKISVDSATMMNKALEVIEAHFLFNMPPEKIEVLLHPQSLIHSMVEYSDGSVLAQLGPSDMRVPIASALGWPKRVKGACQSLDFTKISQLTFEPLDSRRFPAINFAYDMLREGGAACAAMNAANEVAVAAFLGGQIGYLDIFRIVEATVRENQMPDLPDLASIIFFDAAMRESAKQRIVETDHTKRKAS